MITTSEADANVIINNINATLTNMSCTISSLVPNISGQPNKLWKLEVCDENEPHAGSEDVASDLSDFDINNEIEEVESDIAFVENLEGITTGSVSDLYNFREVVKEVGKYVVVNYEGTFYPGKITKILDEGAVISTMQKSLKSWKWPTHEDAISYSWDEVIGGKDAPQQISKRGFYNIPELS
ncbi:hypothetical protein FQA39_LY15005 [Lamprigera yunnana]|nr:hypothetical protein FQA39_LY15005 [Lamprigera yunnana]